MQHSQFRRLSVRRGWWHFEPRLVERQFYSLLETKFGRVAQPRQFVGRAFGLDIFAPGYDNASIGGILLCGLGGGAGLQLARWALAKTRKDDDQK